MKFAKCHPDRKHHAKGKCSSCHRRYLEQQKYERLQNYERANADYRVKQVREELTRFVYTADRVAYDRNHINLNQPPEKPMVVIALTPAPMYSFMPKEYVSNIIPQKRFRAIRKAWDDGHGNIVNWWDWEPC